MTTTAPTKIDVTCPVCRQVFTLPMTVRAYVRSDRPGMGFLTADASVGGIDHVCNTPPPEVKA